MKRHLFAFFAVLLFLVKTENGLGQAATATWALTSNNNAAVTGNVTAIAATTMGLLGTPLYSTTYGMRTYGWTTTASRNTGQYYQLKTTPNAGNSLLISSISFYTRSSIYSFFFQSVYYYDVYYSTDNFTTSAALVTANPLSTSSTQQTLSNLSINVPNGSAFSLRIYFYDADGTSSTYYAGLSNVVINGKTNVPYITSFSPSSGCANTGVVNIIGTSFTGATSVKIGGTAASSYTINSATSITALVGNGTTGTIAVTNANGTGTSTGIFTVNPTPSAISITPSSADVCYGSIQSLTASGGIANSSLLNENFNGTAPGWTKTNTSYGGTPANADWTLQPDNYEYDILKGFLSFDAYNFHSNDNSQFFLSNSDAQGFSFFGEYTTTTLTSPAVNTVGYQSLTLSFYQNFLKDPPTSDAVTVQVSTDGINFTSVNITTTSQGPIVYTGSDLFANYYNVGFSAASVNLNAYINKPVLYIRFKYTADYGYWWAIDNVTLSGQSQPIVWSPVTDLYTDAAATTVYVGTPATTVYSKPIISRTYIATSAAGSCISSASALVNVSINPTWTGSTSTDWNVASNWCNGSIPISTSTVIIPVVVSNRYPVISNNDAYAASVTIANIASLTMNGTGSLNLSTGGNFTNNGTFTATASTGAVNFVGTGIINGAIATTFKNISMNGQLTLSVAPTIIGTFQVKSGTVVTNNPIYTNTSTLLYNISGTYTTSREWYNGGSTTTAPGDGIPQNVIIQSGSITFNTTGTANRCAAGNIQINAGTTLNLNTKDLFVLGNWTNSGAFTHNNREVTFDGASDQTISGNTIFYNLIEKQTGGANLFIAATLTKIDHNFTAASGTMKPNVNTTVEFTGNGILDGVNNKVFYDLLIDNSANMTLADGGASIDHNFINNGTYTYSGASKVTTFSGSGIVQTLSGITGNSTTFGSLVVGSNYPLSNAITLNCATDYTVKGGSLSLSKASTLNNSNNTVTFTTANATISGSGTANFYNVVTDKALDFGTSPVTSNISNLFTINTGGSVVLHAPTYGTASTLIYNTTTSNFTNAFEWNGITPTPGLGVPKNVTVQNTNSLTIAGDRGLQGALSILSGNKLFLNGKTLTLNGTITGTGTLSGSAISNLTIGSAGTLGTLYFDQGTDNVTNVLKDMAINSGTATLGNALNITAGTAANTFGSLTANGILNTGGLLTLRSNSFGDAIVGQSAGTVSGNVTIERYIPGRRAWRFLGVPFSSSGQSINQAWQEGLTDTTLTCPTQFPGTAGYGTEITYNGANGYDLNTTVNPSIKVWNHTAWTTPTSTLTTNIADYKAYCLFVRGDRNICLVNGVVAPNNTILRATGVVNESGTNGNAITSSFSGLAAGENVFVGNPYASPVNLYSVFANTNNNTSGIVNEKFAVWDAHIGGSYGVGGYATVLGNTIVPNGGTDTYPTAAKAAQIQSGGAFFVYTSLSNLTGSASFTFQEANKINNQFNTFSRMANAIGNRVASATVNHDRDPRVYINLMLPSADSAILLDGTAAVFDSAYSYGIDDYDAGKKFNFNENIGLKRDGKSLAIEARPLPQAWDTLYVHTWLLTAKDYAIQTRPEFVPSAVKEAWLIDNYLKFQYHLSLTDTTNYNFTANADTNSYAGRFMIVFRVERKQPQAIAANDRNNNPKALNIDGKITVSPNPVTGTEDATLRFINMSKGSYEIEMYNTAGRKMLVRTIIHAGGSSTYPLKINPAWAADKYDIVIVNKETSTVNTLSLIIAR